MEMSFITNDHNTGKWWDKTFCGFNRPQFLNFLKQFKNF